MLSRKIEIDGIGTVLFQESKRARRISITIKPFKGIIVAIPIGIPFVTAYKFLQSRKNWILKSLVKIRVIEEESQKTKSLFSNINKEEARRILKSRLDELAIKHGFKYNRVFIRNQKTRWGSCSSRGNISLNINLVKLPHELMDYVILHELVHTRIKNHSKKFWKELGELVGDVRPLKMKLREYRLGLV